MRAALVILALLLGSASAQVTTSPNLVPTPSHWTTGGNSIAQSYAINQALALSGSPVRIQGFDWGYNYSLDAGGSVTSSVNITNSSNQSIYSNTYTQNDAPTYGVRSKEFTWNMPTAVPAVSLGNFNWTLNAQGDAVVFDSYSRARYTVDAVSNNLVYTSVNPAPLGATYTWNGFNVVNSFGGVSGGNTPGYKVATGEFAFGYTQSLISYSMAINSALSGSGIQVSGVQYGMQYYNQDNNRGNLTTTVAVKNSGGDTVASYTHALPQTVSGWTDWDQSKMFANPYSLASLGDATMTFSGKDDRFWAGYYGPMFRNPYIRLTYFADTCAADPLSSPTCAGYAEAYFTQQCTANALYNAGCPGYAVAYFNQQCSINALYNSGCPGYAEAYFTQQCTANPLYNNQCPGYATAYFNQQCQQNGLYDRTCPNYGTAYATQQVLNSANSATATTTAVVSPAESTTSNAPAPGISNPTVSAAVNTVTAATNPTSPTSVVGPVSVIAPPPKPGAVESAMTSVSVSPPPSAQQQTERQQDQKKTDAAVATVERGTGGNRAQATQRAAAAAREAVNRSAAARTLEDQAATQGVVVGLMGYVAGFSAYQSATVPDTLAAAVGRQYTKPTVDNRAAQRGLSGANDYLHQRMVEEQYRLGR